MENISKSTIEWLKQQLSADFEIEKHSYSNQDDVYKIQTADRNFYLKISSTLDSEHNNLLKTRPFLEVPNVISYDRINDKDHLLISEVPGKNLAELAKEWTPILVAQEFAQAVKHFHQLDINKIFPESKVPGLVVLHGDMSLPNVICTEPGLVSYIDLGQMSVGTADIDLADAIWSLQRNIGSNYGEVFLKEYGDVVMTEKLDEALKFRYSQ